MMYYRNPSVLFGRLCNIEWGSTYLCSTLLSHPSADSL